MVEIMQISCPTLVLCARMLCGYLHKKFAHPAVSAALVTRLNYVLRARASLAGKRGYGHTPFKTTKCQIDYKPMFDVHTDRTGKQDAQLSQRDCAARCVIVLAKTERLELGDNILRTL